MVIPGEGADSYVYAAKLTQANHQALSFSESANVFYDEDEERGLDFLQPLITFIVSLFTDNYHILFGVFSLVFGFFYSRNIWVIFDSLQGKIGKEVFFLLFVFAMVVPIWLVNGVRMWTGAHIFLYGALPYLLRNNKKSLIWCFVSIFMHFSFIFPLAILAIFITIGNRSNFYCWFFIVSFFFIQTDLGAISEVLQAYLPSVLQPRVKSYTNVNYAETIDGICHCCNMH
jgi:VanZ family protein